MQQFIQMKIHQILFRFDPGAKRIFLENNLAVVELVQVTLGFFQSGEEPSFNTGG